MGEEEGKMARKRIMVRLSHGSPTFTLKVDNGEGKIILSQELSLQNPSPCKAMGGCYLQAPHDVGWSPCARHMGNILSNHLARGGDLSEDEENPEEEINPSVNPSS